MRGAKKYLIYLFFNILEQKLYNIYYTIEYSPYYSRMVSRVEKEIINMQRHVVLFFS